MRRPHTRGGGIQRIGRELGVSPPTGRHYLRRGFWLPFQAPARTGVFDPHHTWMRERPLRHRGNAGVLHDELRRDLGLEVGLRTVERAVVAERADLRAKVGRPSASRPLIAPPR